MKIVTLYQPQHTDGYRHFPEGVYFESSYEANKYSETKYGAYSVKSVPVKAITSGEGGFYLLKQEDPIYLHNSSLDKEKRKEAVLTKLTQEERELLGL